MSQPKPFFAEDLVVRSVGIIGYGRFGQLVLKILRKYTPQISVKVSSASNKVDRKTFFDIKEVAGCDIVIPAVPISVFEDVIKDISPLLNHKATVIDVCSVKVYPKKIMLKYLEKNINIVATHPMFGPGDVDAETMKLGKSYNFVIENVRCDKIFYGKICRFVESLGINLLEMSADEHERLSAKTQFITLVTAFALKDINFSRSSVDTKTAQNLRKSVDGVTIDISLLKDMYKYNPYCEKELQKYKKSFGNVFEYITNVAVTR